MYNLDSHSSSQYNFRVARLCRYTGCAGGGVKYGTRRKKSIAMNSNVQTVKVNCESVFSAMIKHYRACIRVAKIVRLSQTIISHKRDIKILEIISKIDRQDVN